MGATLTNWLAVSLGHVGLPLLLLSIGGSATLAGIAIGATTLTGIISQGISGALTDHFRADRVLRWACLVQAVAWAAICLQIGTQVGNTTLLIVCACTAAAAAAATKPSELTLIRSIVPAGDLATATTLSQARQAVATLTGQPAGGALFGFGALWIPSVISMLHGIATVLTPRIQRSTHSPATRMPLGFQVAHGFRYVLAHQHLRAITLIISLINFPMTLVPLGMIAYLNASGVSGLKIGIYSSCLGVGILLGSILSRPLSKHMTIGAIGILTLALQTAGWAATVFTYTHFAVICVISVLSGLTIPAVNAVLNSYKMMCSPEHMTGRIIAATEVPGMILMPLGYLAAGILYDTAGITTVLVVGTCAGALPLLMAVVLPSFRCLPYLAQVTGPSSTQSQG